MSRDVRIRRLDDQWLVHFRADAPANLGFGLSDAALQAFVGFGAGLPTSSVPADRRGRMLPLTQAGMLIGTGYRLGGTPVAVGLDEIQGLRQAIPVDATGMLELETLLLYLLARENQLRGAVVELGSYMGGSTIALGLGAMRSRHRNPVVAVDDHEWHRHVAGQVSPDAIARLPSTLPTLERNLANAGLSEAVSVVVADTAAASSEVGEPVSLLLVDAGHDARALRADIDAWLPKVASGGIVAFHDYHNSAWPDVERTVDEARATFAEFVSYQTLAIARMP